MRSRYGVLTLPLFCALMAFAFLAVVPLSAEGAIFCVTEGGGGGNPNTGDTWTNAFSEAEFYDKLLSAPEGTEFWVAKGRYRPSTTGIRSVTFPIKPGVAVYGGFAGTETARDQRNWKTNVTVLTGDLAFNDEVDDGITRVSSDIKGTNSLNVLNAEGSDAATILDGFVITAGDSEVYGGGIFNPNGGVAIRNCSFYGNRASQGGALYMASGSTSTVTDCTFSGNSANMGAAIFNDESASLIQRCFFEANFAVLDSGGGIYSTGSPAPEVDGCTFFKNKAGDRGGGMYVTNDARVKGSTFTENEAADGGGMFNIDFEPVVTNCTFSKNTATANGGGMQNYEDATTIVMNCTFSGNSAALGGNMYNYLDIKGNPTVTNSIFWGGVNGEIIDEAVSNTVVSYSVVQGGYGPGSDIITTDPKLGPLAPTEARRRPWPSSPAAPPWIQGPRQEPLCWTSGESPAPRGGGYDIGAFEVEVGGGSRRRRSRPQGEAAFSPCF
ncbi:hypothetical protein MASR2M79_15440 [Aminivibrio sp.]